LRGDRGLGGHRPFQLVTSRYRVKGSGHLSRGGNSMCQGKYGVQLAFQQDRRLLVNG